MTSLSYLLLIYRNNEKIPRVFLLTKLHVTNMPKYGKWFIMANQGCRDPLAHSQPT